MTRESTNVKIENESWYHPRMVNHSYDPEELIRQAFRQAALSGKDPGAMSIAVLKNRMLALSNGKFAEEQHSASSFLQFLKKFPALLKVDTSEFPPVASFLDVAPEPQTDESPEREFVRGDLWRAILDYSSGTKYVWDGISRKARPARPEDDLPEIPTISEQNLIEWKKDFATKLTDLDSITKGRVDNWAEQNLATRSLPARQRELWNHDLKSRVRDRISEFAKEHGLSLPLDRHQRGASASEPDLEDLRQLMVDCIKIMTKTELGEIRVSPEVLLRIRPARR